ncbi:MAG: transporter [Frankiales bacterium]|nr:transporter [Frankiales bacterium]
MSSSTATRSRYQVTFVVLAVATGAYSLLQSLVSPVLPLLETSLHTNQNTVTWVLTAYLLSASVFTPILGRIGDMVGKEKVLVAVLIALTLGTVLAAVATSISVMIIARVIQGVGGGVIPLAVGIVRDEVPRDKVAGAVGVIAALLAVGGGLGLVLAGPIVNGLDYHWLFWIPAVVVAAAAIATYFFVPESPVRTPGTISWLAAVLLSGWLVALLVAVSQAPSWGWFSTSVIGLLVAAIVLAVAWVLVEIRSAQPLIDMRMMRIPAVWTTNLVALLFGVGLYSVFAFIPEFLQTPSSAGYGFTASITESGLIVLPMSVTMFAFGATSGRLSARFGARAVLIAGSVLSVPSFAIMTFAHSSIWQVALAMLLLGAGFGLAFSAMSNIIVDAVPSHQTGVASGMNANIRTIGGSVGAAVMASIVTSGALPSGLPKESGYTAGFGMLAVAMAFSALAAVLIPRLRVQRDAHQVEQAAMSHPELALVAAGTVVGDESE